MVSIPPSTQPERFIPISRPALLNQLVPHEATEDWQRLWSMMTAWYHHRFRERLNRARRSYLAFSPDRDTLRVDRISAEARARDLRILLEEVAALLDRANYRRIDKAELLGVLSQRSPYGLSLQVDLGEFEELYLFARGSGVDTRQQRDWRSLWLRSLNIEIPVYQRLFLLLKLKPEGRRIQEVAEEHGLDMRRARRRVRRNRATLPRDISGDHVYLKLFRNIPQVDLEMLFPNTRIRLKPLDKMRLGVTCGGGTLGGVAAGAGKLAAAASPVGIAMALGGVAAVIFRQVTTVISHRNRYMMLLARRLYFHNLANNRGALTLLADRAEEEELKETMLAYWLLAGRPERPWTHAGLDQAAEAFLEERFGVRVDFDTSGALEKLRRDGLIIEQGDGVFSVPPVEQALHRLDSLWREAWQEAGPEETDAEEA